MAFEQLSPSARESVRRLAANLQACDCRGHDVWEYYVQCFRRVQLCHDKGMSQEDIARATAYSLPLVQQYLDLIKRFGLPFPMLPTTSGKDGE